MTARDTIAQTIHVGWCLEPNHEDCDGVDATDERIADAVIRAVRGMPDEDVADLIGGRVEYHPGRPVLYQVVGPTRSKR